MLQNWAYRLLMFVISFVVSVDAGTCSRQMRPPSRRRQPQTPGGPEKPSAEAAIRQSLTKTCRCGITKCRCGMSLRISNPSSACRFGWTPRH